jgi:hypothetical protein
MELDATLEERLSLMELDATLEERKTGSFFSFQWLIIFPERASQAASRESVATLIPQERVC